MALRSEGAIMSQELLFLLFMVFEGVFLITLYQFYLVPKVISPAVVEHWLSEIESGRIFLPKVLESYTGELLGQVDALFFGYVDDEKKVHRGRIQKFYEGAAGKTAEMLGGEEGGIAANIMKQISLEPWYVQAIAQKLMPVLQKAGDGLTTAPVEPPVATYRPGIARK